MSTKWEYQLTVREFDPTKVEAIKAVVQAAWPQIGRHCGCCRCPETYKCWTIWNEDESVLATWTKEEGWNDPREELRVVAQAIWKANGGPCAVEIRYGAYEDMDFDSVFWDSESPPDKPVEDD